MQKSGILPPPLSAEEETDLLLQLNNKENVQAKLVLIERNLHQVVSAARRFEDSGMSVEDLTAIGTIGLIKAVNTFKQGFKIKFDKYITDCIEKAISSYIQNQP